MCEPMEFETMIDNMRSRLDEATLRELTEHLRNADKPLLSDIVDALEAENDPS